MRPRWQLGLAALLTLSLLATGAVLLTLAAPALQVSAFEIDGHHLGDRSVPEVSPRPRLLLKLSQAVRADDLRLSLDGQPLPVSGGGGLLQVLNLFLPGPLPLGSRHTIQVSAGGTSTRVTFRVVDALQVDLGMRFQNLQADGPVSVVTTVRFSSPVADRAQAQQNVRLNVPAAWRWLDPQTIEARADGLQLGTRVAAIVDDGIAAANGSYSRGRRSASLTVPSTITQVVPGRLVEMYYVNSPDSRASLFAHLRQIDMLSPGWYDANADGSITGYARRDVIDAAHANGIQLVPLVVNAGVDADVAHAILADPARRAALARNLVQEAKTYGYAGFQIDFEQVRWTDRDLLTALVQDCAAAFHPAGLSLSEAVIPRLPGDDAAGGAQLDYFHAWSGAYDYPALARAADFLAFMTYDEHNGVTPPGPVSGIPWMRQALDYSLQGVPPEKATVGLPTYYHDWVGIGNLTSSSFSDALSTAQRYRVTPAFDANEDEMHFTYTTFAGVHHELWYESGDTLRRKVPLLYEYGLRGISVWRLGFEDPAFWDLIPARR